MYRFHSVYRIIALVLAFLVLATSAGLAVDTHYCQGHLKTFSVFGQARGCSDMEEMAPSCTRQHENTCGERMGNRKCCENRLQYFQPDQNQFSQISNSISANPVIPVAAVVSVSKWEYHHDTPAFFRYKPPLIQRDIPVLMQVFRL